MLESSDGLSFYAHKSILSAYSGTFADADHCSSSNDSDPSVGASTTGPVPLELVECSESAEVLSALIRFMYRDEVPIDLQTMDKGDFFDLADAAEKYDVWSLKQLLRTYMPCVSSALDVAIAHILIRTSDHTTQELYGALSPSSPPFRTDTRGHDPRCRCCRQSCPPPHQCRSRTLRLEQVGASLSFFLFRYLVYAPILSSQ